MLLFLCLLLYFLDEYHMTLCKVCCLDLYSMLQNFINDQDRVWKVALLAFFHCTLLRLKCLESIHVPC